MPVIYLKERSGSYEGAGVTVNVTCENNYTPSKLFKKFKHTLNEPQNGKIYVHNAYAGWAFNGNCLTLTPNGQDRSCNYFAINNPSACLKCVEVYFNKYDTANTPLILVFKFQNGDGGDGNGATNKYYRMSCFDTDAANGKCKNIEDLCTYNEESDILCPLLEENDTLEQVLTYDILRKPTNGGDDGSPCNYNCGKIQVKDDTSTYPSLSSSGFKRYKHTPVNGRNNGSKKACVIYRCNTLMGNGSGKSHELPNIQNQVYTSITVYFGQMAKRPCNSKGGKSQCPGGGCATEQGTCPTSSGNVCPTTPGAGGSACKQGQGTCPPSGPDTGANTNCDQDVLLMIELHGKNGITSGDQPQYYVHRRKTNNGEGKANSDYYWVKLPCGNGDKGDNGTTCILKDLLEDIGFSTKKDDELRYEALKQLLTKAGINGVSEEGDLSGKLKELKGSKLQKLLKEKVNLMEICPGVSEPAANGKTTLLDLLLRQIEFDLTDSVIILMDRKKNGDGGYGDSDIKQAIKNLQPKGKQNRINALNGKGQTITLSQEQNGLCKCLTKYKYCVIKHDFSNAVSKLGTGCSVGIRFFIPTADKGNSNGKNTKYTEIRLYSIKEKGPQYPYYTKGGSNGVASGVGTCTNTCSTTGDKTSCDKVYVVFYGGTDGTGCKDGKGDPRPLMLCYNGCAYVALDEEDYFRAWIQVGGVNPGECLCTTGGDPGCAECEKLLLFLTVTVGYLNRVNLYEHPKGTTGSEGQPCHNVGSSVSTTDCKTIANGADKCKYQVHKYKGQDVKIQVTCCPVNGTSGSQSCYKKLTHKPAGINGATDGFRLGDVEYFENGGSGEWGIISYYQNGDDNVSTEHKWNPLTQVTVYYYNEDKTYADPLLVELQFAKVDGVNGDNNKEYYKLIKREEDSLDWMNDTENAKKAVQQKDGTLTNYLDRIRYCLKLVVKIELHHRGGHYPLMGRKGSESGSGNTFDTPINGPVKVEVQECPGCPSLSSYKCVKHGLTDALAGKHHDQVAGLAFTLPGSEGKVIEIQLYEAQGAGQGTVAQSVCPSAPSPPGPASQGTCTPTSITPSTGKPVTPTTTDGKIDPITYNKCMGDICVYFYQKGGGTSGTDTDPDTVPLMLKYNGQFYKPENRDCYFDRWVCVNELCKVADKDCGCCGTDGGTGCQKLCQQLDKVNEALNQIDLDPSKAQTTSSNGSGYGLPEGNGGGHKLDEKVGNVRVNLVLQTPKGDDAKSAYLRVVHRTKNGFRIGDITYCKVDITKCGITPNGTGGAGTQNCTGSSGTTITIANSGAGVPNGNKNHLQLVNDVQANTVVVYYSKNDAQCLLPQLIVILNTDSKVNGNTVTGTEGKNYGYYILATKNGGGGKDYEYQWRLVNGGKPPVTLDDETDFKLLNAAVLLVEQTGTYNEKEIEKAIQSAIKNGSTKKSPGRDDTDINRLTGKSITVTTQEPWTHQCLNSTGFKVMTHNITSLVELDPPFKDTLTKVTLITGLRFLIPTHIKGEYRKLTLKDNGSAGENASIKYHQTGHDNICVYFYCSDPRPLVICYNSWTYKPKSKAGYFGMWFKDSKIDKCDCSDNCKEELLKDLVEVSDFLNPVSIDVVPTSESQRNWSCYIIHWFNGTLFWMKVESKPPLSDSFCFKQYVHTHFGIGCGGEGFRMGDIHHGTNCIKLNGGGANGKCVNSLLNNSSTGNNNYKTADSVAVFYYKHDSGYKTPVLVAMCTKKDDGNGVKCNLYYVLKSRATKTYTKNPKKLDLNDSKQLEDALTKALFENSKKLQIVLGKLPEATKYPEVKDKKCTIKGSSNGANKLEGKDDHEKLGGLRACKGEFIMKRFKGHEDKHESLLYHVVTKTSYQAQLSGPESPPETTPTNTQITVEEIPCSNLYEEGGYRCFKHVLTTAEGIEQVGGLKLCIWTDRGGAGKGGKGGDCKACQQGGGGGSGTQDLQLCTKDAATTTPQNGPATCTTTQSSGVNGTPCQNGYKKLERIEYTTCKGDLYVIFYGEDPSKFRFKKVPMSNLVLNIHSFVILTFFKKYFK